MRFVRPTRADTDAAKVKWRRDPPSDEVIAAQIAGDADTAAEWTAAELASARHVVATPTPDDVRAIRFSLGLTQKEFADRFGFSVETIRNYEQGHRRPTGAVRVLLRVIACEPDAVARALSR